MAVLLALAVVAYGPGARTDHHAIDPVLQQLSESIGQAVSLCDHVSSDNSGQHPQNSGCDLCALCAAVDSLAPPVADTGYDTVRFARFAIFRRTSGRLILAAHLVPVDGRPRAPPVAI